MHYPPVEDITPFVERSRKSLRDEVLDLPSPAEPCGDTTLTETQLPKRRGPSLQMPRPKLGINREAEPSVEQVQIQTMKGTMERMSDRVETIANTLQHYAMFGGTGQDDLFLAIAELKQIKDILKGDIDA